jgi:four helix bundle protein
MDESEFKDRTRRFGLEAIRFVQALPRNPTADIIGRQLLRSATAVGANYRSACRGRSAADVISRLSIVEEEADEAIYWIELLTESGLVSSDHVTTLVKEGNEIVAMTVASIKTLRRRLAGHEMKSKIQ